MKLRKRIYFSICTASFITLVLTVFLAAGVMYRNMSSEVIGEVKNEALFMSVAMNKMDDDSKAEEYALYAGKYSENRITLVSSDGTVIYDNYADVSMMDNHIERPEIKAAVNSGTGEMTRSSDTIGMQTYYYAVRLDNGDILRIASTTKNIVGLLGISAPWLIIIMLIVFAAAMITAKMLTDSVVKPINDLDLDDPASNETYDELAPLLVRMDKQNSRIRLQMEKLSEQQREFEYITENMSEGLVIFGQNGNIISSNDSARKILDSENVGYYNEMCRDSEYIRTVEEALQGNSANGKLLKGERIFSLSASPVEGTQKYGAVLFITEITERENAEKMRREFSANVSHELKTPLTSIMGAAEIIENGIAKQEDIPHFASQIHDEASRLLTLIRDIIKLSQLDEGSIHMEFEQLDLKEICEDVIKELKNKAESKNVTISFNGNSLMLNGVRAVLHEMIYNLCDNAIVYNKDGGNARITLVQDDTRKYISVSDTGIGIAEEDKNRIFERFYRVDKSHSKATGGTGLGLSIVKHGAVLHGGRISVDSSIGSGTTIMISF